MSERARAMQANDVAGLVIQSMARTDPDIFVNLHMRHGIADTLWDAGYRRVPALEDGSPEKSRREIHTGSLLIVYRPGDYPDRPWEVEFDRLWVEDQGRMDLLATSIQETGIHEPILLGADGRVWDGHHRLAIAYRLGIDLVPVTFSGTDESL